MRNYVKTLFMRWQFIVNDGRNGFIFVYGADDDNLRQNCSIFEAVIRGQYAPAHTVEFFRVPPTIIWWELNKENLVLLLNGPIPDSFGTIYDSAGATRIGQAPANVTDAYWGISRIGGIEPSPRKTWSHGH